VAQRRRRRRRPRRPRETPTEDSFWEDFCLRISAGKLVPIIGHLVRTERIFDINYDRDLGLPDKEYDAQDADLTVQAIASDWAEQIDHPFPDEELLDQVVAFDGVQAEVDDVVKTSYLRFLKAYLSDLEEAERAELNIEEELAQEWASEIAYPFPDNNRLARVAIYNSIKREDEALAKQGYLRFLKEYLLYLAEEDRGVLDQLDELKGENINSLTFSDIASWLDYPRFERERDDPLRQLARLPLPVYVTTSYFDFMERALVAEGRYNYRTHICFLHNEPLDVAPEHRLDPDFRPSFEQPVVIHLHGLERYPESLVLSEDDYLDFVVKVVKEKTDQKTPFIPLYLWEALAESSLMLLGYRLYDWDFRVLFRGLISARPPGALRLSLTIQLDPAEQSDITDKEEARNYLRRYFKPSRFRVEWGTADDFVKQLGQRYDEWRRKA
jgi:hypothetical protein